MYCALQSVMGDRNRSIDGINGIGFANLYRQIKEGISSNKIQSTTTSPVLLSEIFTDDDMKEDFGHFDKTNECHKAQASWYGEMPCEEVAEYANALYKELFPANPRFNKRKERQRACFKDFTDYSVFKQEVLEMVGELGKFETRKEHWNYLRQQEDGYNQYAYRFIMHYTNDNNQYINSRYRATYASSPNSYNNITNNTTSYVDNRYVFKEHKIYIFEVSDKAGYSYVHIVYLDKANANMLQYDSNNTLLDLSKLLTSVVVL